MTISNTLSSIITNLSNAYDMANSMGATMPVSRNMENLASTIGTIQAGGGDDKSPELIMGTISEYIDTEGKVEYIRSSAFSGISTIQKVNFPECSIINYRAFAGCSYLSEISFPKCINIGNGAFQGCSSLTGIINLPIVYSISNAGFNGCYKITEINCPICNNFDANAFYNCSLLSKVYAPFLNSIGGSAFAGCSYLSEVSFPCFEKVGQASAFYNCYTLKSALFGVDIYSIYSSCFLNCSSLESLYICTCKSITLGTSVFNNTPIADNSYLGYYGSIYVPSQAVSYFKASTNWSVYSDRITSLPASFDSKFIYGYEFESSDITEIPSAKLNCEYIGRYAFTTTSITEANLSYCKYVGRMAFASCPSLSQAIFPECITTNYQAFTFAQNLKQISFPKITMLGSGTFQNCASLSEANLSECIFVGYSAFQACKYINKVSLPKCLILESGVFQNCSYSLSQVIIGTQLSKICTLINVNAFQNTPMSNSNNLGYYGSIYVPDSLVSAYQSATNWVTYSSRITGISNLPSV